MENCNHPMGECIYIKSCQNNRRCMLEEMEIKTSKIHDESGPFPNLEDIRTDFNKKFANTVVVFGTSRPKIAYSEKQLKEFDKEAETSKLNFYGNKEAEKNFEGFCKAMEELDIERWFGKKIKCQKPGCGKILSPPTNHRCDHCYSYHQ